MKAILILFDSLNRHFLNAYRNGETRMKGLENFDRLAQKTVRFENSYSGSLPCIPARRELHTGRYNFMLREWGPIEPFDDSMPEILKKNGIYTHLITDHFHYWEDGGAGFLNRYNTYELIRGQEGDRWKAHVKDPDIPEVVQVPLNQQGTEVSSMWRYDWVNREYTNNKDEFPQNKLFGLVEEFIDKNHMEDNWFLQLESFDPHEPFFVPDEYMTDEELNEIGFDWPRGEVEQTDEEIMIARRSYERLLKLTDKNLGRILDKLDQHDMWDDTLIIVGTDHGFSLSEHGYWGKNSMPYYNEVANTPLFIWDPRSSQKNVSRNSLVQLIDWAPTILNYFEIEPPKDMLGQDLTETIKDDKPNRDTGLFGTFSEHINITDGRYVYMKSPVEDLKSEIYNYTLMPVHMKERFRVDEMKTAELVEPFNFTKGMPLLKIKSNVKYNAIKFGTLFFDTQKDPKQLKPTMDEKVVQRLEEEMIKHMEEHDTPKEVYVRYGLKK